MFRFVLVFLALLSVGVAGGIPSCVISQELVKKAKSKVPMYHIDNYFSNRYDMCEGTDTHTCTNEFETIRNLQIALNHDKNINVNLKVDGQWGKATKEAVIKYQKYYHILPADGWVGKRVKKSLDKTAKDVLFPSDFFSRQDDMCESTPDHNCTNDYNAIRNLQIAFNKDPDIRVDIPVDGKWGDITKLAVKIYQVTHHIKPVDGWVGKNVKKYLDITTKGLLFPKNKISDDRKGKRGFQGSFKTFASFKKHINLRKSYKIYKNPALLRQSTKDNVKLLVDTATQRITLFVKGKVALNSPCTTGSRHKLEPNTKTYRDKRTPKGRFHIMEKIRDKRSTIFGDYFVNGKRVYHGDRTKFYGDKTFARFVGASLRYWMRLTSGGIGLHGSGHVKRYAGSNGCVRLPFSVAKIIFSKVSRGTTVRVR